MACQKTNSEIVRMMFSTEHHKHPLELKNFIKPYICDGCKEEGFGPRYRCEECNFDLHKECTEIMKSTSHDFIPNSTFHFLTTPPKVYHEHCKRRCIACRNPSNNGFVYHCKTNDLDLHPCCMNLQRKYEIKIGGDEGEKEDLFEFNLHKKVQKKCLWCNKKSLKEGGKSNGWSYISKCNTYHVHVGCITQMISKVEWNIVKSDTINKINYNGKEDNHKTLALQKVNFKEIQAKRKQNGKSGNKYLRILEILIKAIVGFLVGDPTTVVVSLLVGSLA